MKITFSTLLIFFFILNCVKGQEAFWSVQDDRNALNSDIQTVSAMRYSVDIGKLRSALEAAPVGKLNERLRLSNTILLPNPSGGIDTFDVVNSPIMQEGLSAKYPAIQTFRAVKKGDPTVKGSLDITYQGFHAMIFENGEQWFIDPINRFDSINYQVYYKSDFRTDKRMICLVNDRHDHDHKEHSHDDRAIRDCSLRTYRTCVAATGEYSQFHGGTKPLALSAIVTSVNRVNHILNMDMAINLILIDNNDEVIYLNGSSDPYSNGDGGEMLGENIETLSDIIGSANYDFGHVFSTGGGGVAYLNSVCGNSKAGGVTGSGSPVNDPFDIDYVAHEMGHQMGGNHTQNNSCNRANTASYEPGSASTIMGYAGICSPNVQNNSDAYYHVRSLEEMTAYMYNGNGNSCAQQISLENTPPEIVNVPTNLTLPISTPFELTAEAIDDDGDDLLFCWEQYNNEIGDMPPASTNPTGPVFRSLNPTSNPTRVFPNIEAVINNETPTWEVLPSVSRDMDFKVTVRDRFEEIGCIDTETSNLNFDNSAGPFLVTYPNSSGIILPAGVQIGVSWDVANTSGGAVNAATVDIFLSEDGGYTYPYLLAENVPNVGTADVFIPAIETEMARIKVKGNNHVFFDISDNNFTIETSESTFVVTTDKLSTTLCPGQSDAIIFSSLALLGYTGEITFSLLSPAPQGLSVNFSEDVIEVGESTTMSMIYNSFNSGGTYILEVLASDGEIERIINITVNLVGLLNELTLFSPAFEENNVSIKPTFSWSEEISAESYILEISTDINFEVDVYEFSGIQSNSYEIPEFLDQLTTYYWRVMSVNACESSPSESFGLFQTENCKIYQSQDVPLTIPSNQSTSITSSLIVPTTFYDQIIDLDVISVFGTHTWMEDLVFRINKSGNEATLVEQECGDDNDFSFSFDDSSSNSNIECGQPVGMGLTYQPVDNLDIFNGMDPAGEWNMEVDDVFAEDGGVLENWGLKFCFENNVCSPVGIPTNTGIYIADSECTDEFGWTHYYKSAAAMPITEQEVLLLSIKKDGVVEINPNQVVLGVGTDPVLHMNNVEYVPNPGIWYVLSRYWEVNPSVQPGSAGCLVRYYFLENEIDELLDEAGQVYGLGSLRKFKFDTGSNIDPNPENGHLEAGEADFVLIYPEYDEYNIKLYAEFEVDGFSGGGLGAGGELPLPIELLSFSGKDTEEGHHLMWKTGEAENFDKFEIEISKDGRYFRSIGTIMYNENLSDYLFINTLIDSEITYYRLKMIDVDESVAYSHIISLKRQKLRAVSFYPNPVSDILNIKITNEYLTKSVEIINSLGQTLTSTTTVGEELFTIDVRDLAPGVYFIRINNDSELEYFEFVKQ